MRLILSLEPATWHPAWGRRRAPLWWPGAKRFAFCWSISWWGYDLTLRVERRDPEWALWYPVLGTRRAELPRDGVPE